MKISNALGSLFIALFFIGCSEVEYAGGTNFSPGLQADLRLPETKSAQKYLAYSHRLEIELPANDISAVFDRVLESCNSDTKHGCTLLHSSLRSSEFPTATIQFRVNPEGVEPIVTVAQASGEIQHRSTDIEDLQDSIVDTDKRLEMLEQYRDRLVKLEQNADSNVESLIKIAGELSQVQSDLEYASGEKSRLRRRVNMDLVNISLQSSRTSGFWSPIGDALAEFSQQLATGISETIRFVAIALPGFLVFLLLLSGMRVFWRKTSATHQRSTR